MKINRIILVAAVATLAASCSKQEATVTVPQNNNIPIKITASFSPDSRADFATISNTSYPVMFKIGDKISVYNQPSEYTLETAVTITKQNYAHYRVTAVDSNTGKATFEPCGTIDPTIFSTSKLFFASTGAFNGSTPTNFLYKIEEGTTSEDNKYYIQSQVTTTNLITANTINNDYFVAYAVAAKKADGSIDFTFKPLTCYVKVTIPEAMNNTLGKMRLNKADSPAVNLSGFYQIIVNCNGVFLEGKRWNGIKAGGNSNIAYNYSSDGSTKSMFPAGTYYLPICPDSSFKSISFWKNTAGSGTAKTFSNTVVTKPGTVLDLGIIPEF